MRKLGINRLFMAAGLVGGFASTLRALPPATVSLLYQSGQGIPSVGAINHPFNGGLYGGDGILGFAINNSGNAFVNVSLNQPPPGGNLAGGAATNQAVLSSLSGTTPYLGGGVEWDNTNPPGSVTLPTTDYVYASSYSTAVNNSGTGLFSLFLASSSFASVTPVAGLYFNKSAMPVSNGGIVTAAGVAPGTTIGSMRGALRFNDNRVALVGCQIVEGGQPVNALLKIAMDANGAVLSQTLVAKVGGPVGAGPATWATLSIANNTVGINNAGDVIFSGTTSTGIDGIYRTTGGGVGGGFVAVAGTPAPNGAPWGGLAGAPVDLNASGHFAFRGVPGGNGGWNEVGDAGETFGSPAGFFTPTTNVTSGGGPLTLISGSLSNDQDVDVYEIRIGDATLGTQVPFSATTVPNPGAGFAGANFDTVLHLFAFDTFNNNGSTRHGVGRCDDAAPGVIQSTLTAASVPPNHNPGNTYFLAIGTKKSRATHANSFSNNGNGAEPWPNLWTQDPAFVQVAGGIAYWVDPSAGQIGRADTATGAPLSPLQVGMVPQQLSGVQQNDPNSKMLDCKLAVYDAGANSKIVFQQHGWGQETFRVCNPDGTGAADLTTTPSSSATTAMAIDSVNAKFYWAKPSGNGNASIYRCDLDGQNPETVLTISDPLNSGEAYVIDSLAIDTFGTGKVYWTQSVYTIPASSAYIVGFQLRRANLDGTTIQTIATNQRASSLSIDSTGRKLYFAANLLNKVAVINLTTLVNTVLVSTAAPLGCAVDAAAGKVYWTSPFERMIRRSNTAAGATEDWLSLGADVGEYPAEGYSSDSTFSAFTRTGAAGATTLPYQIKLTGATFWNVAAMVCKDNVARVASVNENLPGTTKLCTVAGGPFSPVRISDRGVVAYLGAATGGGDNGHAGIYVNSEKVLDDTTIPVGASLQMGNISTTATGLDMCDSGQYLLATGTYLPFSGGGGSTAVKIAFATPPGCAADYNGDGSLSVQDIFDFLGGWFAGAPAADFNGVGGLSVQDIFDFLAAWFAGC